MGNGPVEPAAELRTAASALYQYYVALMMEGFTEKQAMTIISNMASGAGGQA
jgi:hypothetical protein